MQAGSTIIHLLDSHASEREPGTLAHADALAIARSMAARTPQLHHRLVSLRDGSLAGAVVGLRRMARPSDGRGLIHCYSRRGAEAARLSFGRRWPLVLSLGEESQDGPAAWRNALRVAGPDRVLRHGVDAGPAVFGLGGGPMCVSAEERLGIRRAMGIDDEECVVGALAEPLGATNARWLVFFAGILVAGGLGLTVLAPRDSAQLARMRRFHAMTRLNLRVIIVEEGADLGGTDGGANAWNACDVAIARPDPHASGVSRGALGRAIRRSHLAGVPVIAPAGLVHGSLYPGTLAEMLLVLAGTTKQVARTLTNLIENRDELRSAGVRAREAAGATCGEERLAAAALEAYASSGVARAPERTEAMA